MATHESTQQTLINGTCEDIYYANPLNTKKECIKTKQTTKYVQSLTQLSGGTSVFLVPPNFGIQDVVVVLQLPAAAGGAAAGLALPRGWGYAAIKSISYRVGGSTQFFVTGAQLLQHALKRCANAAQRDDLFSLGGDQLTGAALEGGSNYAYIYLDLPWSRPTSEAKPTPLPTDILSSQVQVTVELFPPSYLLSNNGGAIPANFSSFAAGQFQVQQVLMESRDDSLASRESMATHQYTLPVEFLQQEQIVSCANSASVQTITAVGFRAGSVKSIEMWLTKDSDTTGATKNWLKTYAPTNVSVSYAGDIYARFDAGSSQLWNLINCKASAKVNGLDLVFAAGNYTAGTPANYPWVSVPFAQTYDCAETGTFMLVEGLQVTNGIVTISFQTPSAAADWKLHLSYVYSASAVFSQSTCEFVF